MSLFNKYTLYSHRRMLDAAILVQHSFKLPNGDYKVRVRWMRKDGFDFGVSETIRIVSKEVGNWYAV